MSGTWRGGGTGLRPASWFDDVFNVEAYGAVDAAADNTTAVQAAYTAALAAGGGVVWFPEGLWTFNGVEFGSNVHTRGSGPGSILRQLSGVADNTRLLAA